MPFVSEAQRRKCYVMQRQMNEKGLVSKWDCHKFGMEETPASPRRASPRRASPKRRRSPGASSKKVGTNKKGEQIFEGVKGGKFVLLKNKKVYI